MRQADLASLRDLAQGPLAFDLDYSQGYALEVPHLSRVKRAAEWLGAVAGYESHGGCSPAARLNLEALLALNAGSSEPLLLAANLRFDLCRITAATTWEALQSSAWDEPSLDRLQAAWARLDWLDQAERALAMDRSCLAIAFADARRRYPFNCPICGKTGLAELAEHGHGLLENPRQGIVCLLERYPGYWCWRAWGSYADELANLKTLQAGILAVRTVKTNGDWGRALQKFDAACALISQEHAPNMLRNTAPVRRFLVKLAEAETDRSLCVAAIALQRYRLHHGTLPEQLSALVPDFLRVPPHDPMDGRELPYRRQPAGTFLLYSVGEDGRDDGGDPSFKQNTTVFPNYHPGWHGRDVVWPAPATEDQIRNYLAQVGAALRRQAESQPAANTPGLSPAALQAFRRRYGLPVATNPPAGP